MTKKEANDNKKKHPIRHIINTITVIILMILVLILIDISLVTYCDFGPILAIPLHTYDDGGSKEYYGLGYKVIKYHQLQGRRDKEIGPWSLKYNVSPVYIDSLDLAIEFIDDNINALENYNNQLLVVTGVLTKIENKKAIVSYIDENGKYSLDVICSLEENANIEGFELNKSTKVMGKMIKYKKEKKQEINMQHCFIEQ